MMLSKRMTAKRRELKPASQARKRMVKESRDCQPAGCDSPPDSPAGAGLGAAPPAALCAHWDPGPCRLFPRAMRPLHGDELRDDLCLLSGAEARKLGVEAAAGSLRLSSGRDRRSLNSDGPCAPLAIRLLSAAAATAKADGTRAPEKEQEQSEAAPPLGAAVTFPSQPPPAAP
uniref:Uncharacterized protein n=1 Tax=Capra hircus TaxID=9925 RepID=A0A8C2S6M9_CAPHI